MRVMWEGIKFKLDAAGSLRIVFCYQWNNTPQQTEKLFLANFYLKTHKLMLESNLRNTSWTWVVDPCTQVNFKSAENMANHTQNLKSGRSSRSQRKVYKFPFKNNSFDFWEQNVPEILQKLHRSVVFQNRPSAPIGREEKCVNFEFLERRFCKGKPSFVH